MIRTLQPGVGPSKAIGLQTSVRSATGNKLSVSQIHSDQFRPEQSAKASVRFAGHLFFGKTNAEKEADKAESAWYSAEIDQKVPDATIQKRKADYDEAKRLAERTVKLKKRIQQAGGVVGAVVCAGAFATTGIFGGPFGTILGLLVGLVGGAKVGYILTLPIAHYGAEAVHVVRSPEFKKGYKEARAKGKLLI